MRRFKDYRDHLSRETAQEFAHELKERGAEIKLMTGRATIIDPATTTYQSPPFYPIPGGTGTNPSGPVYAVNGSDSKAAQNRFKGKQGPGTTSFNQLAPVALTGSVMPAGFQHYMHCSCYAPKPGMPKPTMEMAEIEQMSEL